MLSVETTTKMLSGGLWQRKDGTVVRIKNMNDQHLMRALLKTLREQPRVDATPLSKEVLRRGLRADIERMAEGDSHGTR